MVEFNTTKPTCAAKHENKNRKKHTKIKAWADTRSAYN